VNDRVFVTQGNQGGRSKVIHTDPECSTLDRAEAVREVARQKYPNGRECERCSGTATPRSENSGSDTHASWKALADASPEDLESPKDGERS
jgi:hypothetical protein